MHNTVSDITSTNKQYNDIKIQQAVETCLLEPAFVEIISSTHKVTLEGSFQPTAWLWY